MKLKVACLELFLSFSYIQSIIVDLGGSYRKNVSSPVKACAEDCLAINFQNAINLQSLSSEIQATASLIARASQRCRMDCQVIQQLCYNANTDNSKIKNNASLYASPQRESRISEEPQLGDAE